MLFVTEAIGLVRQGSFVEPEQELTTYGGGEWEEN